jgi:DNA-binding transcriptional LysR family regulator
VSFVPLRTERFGLGMSRASASDPEPLDLAEARDCDWILPPAGSHYGYAMRAACRRAGFEPNVVHEVTDTAASLALAAAGGGVTPVTDMMRSLAPDPALAVRPLRQGIERSLCLAEALRADHRPSARTVAGVIREVVGSADVR